MTSIVLSTLNARYTHASLGLRYLRANLGALREDSKIMEFIIGDKTERIVEMVLAEMPKIVGFGVYIWNVEDTTKVVAMLKVVAPEVKVIIGGPEVSYETGEQRICQLADFVITGWGDVTFPKLVAELMAGKPQLMKVIPGLQPPLAEIQLPYDEYTDEDIARRTLYVEASRGCPFKCEFCLSALDKTAWPFDLDLFLAAMDKLYQRGARQFKFVDRTFNLNIKASQRILQFFLDKIAASPNDPVYAHFELVPDHLPEALKATIAKFPAGALQFEIGIQTFNPDVQALVSRKQDNDKAADNLRWLVTASHAHMHVDLIAGLPGEDLASFAQGFDRLAALEPHEIQFGILKRLRGTPIIRHTDAFAMRYNPVPPYNILATDRIPFSEMQRLNRFARYWDLVANSGRFTRTLPLLLESHPFDRFMAFSDWLYATTQKTHEMALEKLMDAVHAFLTTQLGLDTTQVEAALADDYSATGAKGKLAFMKRGISVGRDHRGTSAPAAKSIPPRQLRHVTEAA
jgi:radical SAM superfamily enzyme YgiQ (UPF0313 family)